MILMVLLLVYHRSPRNVDGTKTAKSHTKVNNETWRLEGDLEVTTLLPLLPF